MNPTYTVLSKDNTNLMSVDALLNCIKRIYSLVLRNMLGGLEQAKKKK